MFNSSAFWINLLRLSETQNALQLPCVFLLIFLPVVSGTLELQVGIPDFKNRAIWRIEIWELV